MKKNLKKKMNQKINPKKLKTFYIYQKNLNLKLIINKKIN